MFLYVYDVRSITSRRRIFDLQTLPNLIAKQDGYEFQSGPIQFDNVAFKYNLKSQDYVLKDINLTIPLQAKIGIIGQTGSGKTTLLNLITRFYDVTAGTITIKQIPLQQLATKSLLSNISYAFQQPHLFVDTIRNNIKLSNANINDEAIKKLLEQVQLGNFIASKSAGLDFMIQEKGQNLSGGQRQRINIARALARPAQIYIFDDALSALDNITEKQVLQTIFQQTSQAILLISSQKVSTIKDLDQIIVLDQGQISAIGKHEELLASNLIYQEINRLQARGDQDG